MKLYKFTVVMSEEVQSLAVFSKNNRKPVTVDVTASHYITDGDDLHFYSGEDFKNRVASFARGYWSRVLREDYSG